MASVRSEILMLKQYAKKLKALRKRECPITLAPLVKPVYYSMNGRQFIFSKKAIKKWLVEHHGRCPMTRGEVTLDMLHDYHDPYQAALEKELASIYDEDNKPYPDDKLEELGIVVNIILARLFFFEVANNNQNTLESIFNVGIDEPKSASIEGCLLSKASEILKPIEEYVRTEDDWPYVINLYVYALSLLPAHLRVEFGFACLGRVLDSSIKCRIATLETFWKAAIERAEGQVVDKKFVFKLVQYCNDYHHELFLYTVVLDAFPYLSHNSNDLCELFELINSEKRKAIFNFCASRYDIANDIIINFSTLIPAECRIDFLFEQLRPHKKSTLFTAEALQNRVALVPPFFERGLVPQDAFFDNRMSLFLSNLPQSDRKKLLISVVKCRGSKTNSLEDFSQFFFKLMRRHLDYNENDLISLLDIEHSYINNGGEAKVLDAFAGLVRYCDLKGYYELATHLMTLFIKDIKKSNNSLATIFGAINLRQREDIFRKLDDVFHFSAKKSMAFLSLLPHRRSEYWYMDALVSGRFSRSERIDFINAWLCLPNITITRACGQQTIQLLTSESCSTFTRIAVLAAIDKKFTSKENKEAIREFSIRVIANLHHPDSMKFAKACIKLVSRLSIQASTENVLLHWWSSVNPYIINESVSHSDIKKLIEDYDSYRFHRFTSQLVCDVFKFFGVKHGRIYHLLQAIHADQRHSVLDKVINLANNSQHELLDLVPLVKPTLRWAYYRRIFVMIADQQRKEDEFIRHLPQASKDIMTADDLRKRLSELPSIGLKDCSIDLLSIKSGLIIGDRNTVCDAIKKIIGELEHQSREMAYATFRANGVMRDDWMIDCLEPLSNQSRLNILFNNFDNEPHLSNRLNLLEAWLTNGVLTLTSRHDLRLIQFLAGLKTEDLYLFINRNYQQFILPNGHRATSLFYIDLLTFSTKQERMSHAKMLFVLHQPYSANLTMDDCKLVMHYLSDSVQTFDDVIWIIGLARRYHLREQCEKFIVKFSALIPHNMAGITRTLAAIGDDDAKSDNYLILASAGIITRENVVDTATLIPAENRMRFYRDKVIQKHVDRENFVNLMELLPSHERLTFTLDQIAIFDFISIHDVSRLLQPPESLFLQARQKILAHLHAYQTSSVKLHHDRVDYLIQKIHTAKSTAEIVSLLRANSKSGVTNQERYENRLPTHSLFSFGYHKLMKACEEIALDVGYASYEENDWTVIQRRNGCE